jgi:hypothetical protein
MVPTREQRIFVVTRYFHKESYALRQEAFPNDAEQNNLPHHKV